MQVHTYTDISASKLQVQYTSHNINFRHLHIEEKNLFSRPRESFRPDWHLKSHEDLPKPCRIFNSQSVMPRGKHALTKPRSILVRFRQLQLSTGFPSELSDPSGNISGVWFMEYFEHWWRLVSTDPFTGWFEFNSNSRLQLWNIRVRSRLPNASYRVAMKWFHVGGEVILKFKIRS